MRPFYKNLINEYKYSVVPSLPSKIRNLVKTQKNWKKLRFELFIKVLLLRPSKSYFQVLSEKANFLSWSRPFVICNIEIVLVSSKPFILSKLVFQVPEMWHIATLDIFQKALFCTLYSSSSLALNAKQIKAELKKRTFFCGHVFLKK